MGSTGHSLIGQSRTGNVNTETFGIVGAVNFKGKLPKASGMDKVGNNKITLKVKSTDKLDILYQFKLTKDNRLSVSAFDPNTSTSATAVLNGPQVSLNSALRTGLNKDRQNVNKIRSMMAKSSVIGDGQLQAIANKLSDNRRKGE